MVVCGTPQVVDGMDVLTRHSQSIDTVFAGLHSLLFGGRCALEAITANSFLSSRCPLRSLQSIDPPHGRVGGWRRFRLSLREGRDDLAAAAARPHQTIADVARHIAAQLRAMGALEHQVRAACHARPCACACCIRAICRVACAAPLRKGQADDGTAEL